MGAEIDIYSCQINLMAEKFRNFHLKGLQSGAALPE